MADLKTICAKILKKANFSIVEGKDTAEICDRFLRPFVMLNIGYDTIQDLEHKMHVKGRYKQFYKRIKAEWSAVYNIIYKDMTEDEMFLFDDYVEKMSKELQPIMDEIGDRIELLLGDMGEVRRNIERRILLSEIISIASSYMIVYLLKNNNTNTYVNKHAVIGRNGRVDMVRYDNYTIVTPIDEIVNRLVYITKYTNTFGDFVRKEELGKTCKRIDFHGDEKFSVLMNELISKIQKVDSNGIE